MAHYATLREHHFDDSAPDVRGAVLFGEAGAKLARIHDVVFDHENGEVRYLVADYGLGRRVLVPVDRVVTQGASFYSSLSSSDLDRLPAFRDDLLSAGQWYAYEALHRSALDGIERARAPWSEKVTSIDRGRRRNARTESQWTGFQELVRRDLPRIQQDCQKCSKSDRRVA